MASKLFLGETHSELVRKFNELVDEFKSYLPLSGGTLTGNVLLSNLNAQGSQPNLKWKTINSKTPYVGYCTGSTDGTFMVASIGGTTYTTGLSIGGSSGNLLWKGTKVATKSDIPTALKNPKALKFGSKTYDGSSAQTITASDIGANVTVTPTLTTGKEIASIKVGSTTTKLYAPTASVSGDYLPLSGGTMTGNLTIQQGKAINVSQYNDASGVSLMNNGGGTATQFGNSSRPARMFSSVQPEWYKNGASQGVLAIKTDIPTTLSQLTNDADYTTKSYVDANTIKSLSISGYTIIYTKGDGTTGTITTQDTKVKQTHVSGRMLCSLALLPNNTSSEVTDQVYKNTSLYANPDLGTLYATSFYENKTPLSEKYHPKKRKVTLAELQAAMSTMTTGTRIQVVPYGIDDNLLYSVGACITYSTTNGGAYNSQASIDYDGEYMSYYNWDIMIHSTWAQAIYKNYSTDGSSIYVDEALTENLTDDNTDFYILD